MIKRAVSLLQGAAYDWWKLVLRNPLLPDPITWDFFVQEFQTKYVTDDYKDTKWKQFLNLKQGYFVSNSALGLLYGHGILPIYENLLL